MLLLSQLVSSPPLRPLLGYATRPHADPGVERVTLIEDFAELPRVGERAIILLSHVASALAGSYRFDVALRAVRDHSAAALVIAAADARRLTPTAAAIAERSGTAILATGVADLAELAIVIHRELAGGADAALVRVHAAVRAIAAHPPSAGAEALVAHAGAALGVPLALRRSAPEGDPSVPVEIDGQVESWITAPAEHGDLGLALEIVLHAVAARAAQDLAGAARAENLPIQSQEDALSELLSVPEHGRAPIVQRARGLGVPIDGWHVAARLELEDLVGAGVDDHELRYRLSRMALAMLRDAGGTWYSARSGAALVLVRMHSRDPGVGACPDVAAAIDEASPALRARLPGLRLRCGVGGAHSGPAGLLASVAEAQAALTSGRTDGRPDHAVAFDCVGLRRSLVEWYASETAQEAVASVLAPLAALGPAKAERLIATLHAYLDEQGSMSRTAERLQLHRNAVAYRVNQIFSLLDIDRENPDDRLLLQLACRARKLA